MLLFNQEVSYMFSIILGGSGKLKFKEKFEFDKQLFDKQ